MRWGLLFLFHGLVSFSIGFVSLFMVFAIFHGFVWVQIVTEVMVTPWHGGRAHAHTWTAIYWHIIIAVPLHGCRISRHIQCLGAYMSGSVPATSSCARELPLTLHSPPSTPNEHFENYHNCTWIQLPYANMQDGIMQAETQRHDLRMCKALLKQQPHTWVVRVDTYSYIIPELAYLYIIHYVGKLFRDLQQLETVNKRHQIGLMYIKSAHLRARVCAPANPKTGEVVQSINTAYSCDKAWASRCCKVPLRSASLPSHYRMRKWRVW